MGDERPVLVLTSPYDATADYVVDELNHRGHPVFRCNPGEFPAALSLVARLDEGWAGKLRSAHRELPFGRVGCVYYRRPTIFEFPGRFSDSERRWAMREARAGLGGVLATLPRWLNHPVDIGRAECKPLQLRIAQAVGLQVPRTLITNEPGEARAFIATVGDAVYKPLAGSDIAEEGVHKMIYANRVAAADVDETVRGTAHLFQEWVPKAYEVRLTVVDDEYFGVRIDGESPAARIDWRTDYPRLRYSVVEVPSAVQCRVHELLSRLRLRFGALDFVVRPDGTWTFLEINANGQWAWLQDVAGVPITGAMADALTKDGKA